MKLLPALIQLTIINLSLGKLLDTSNEIRSRQKRYLIWFEGVNWLQMIAGIGLPIELKEQSITIGTVVKAFYLLPTNSSEYTRPNIDYARQQSFTSRWSIYRIIENFLRSYGYGDGKSCLLRTICEVASKPFDKKIGILTEILHAILTPSSTRDKLETHADCEYHAAEKLGRSLESCESIFPECKISIIEKFAKFI